MRVRGARTLITRDIMFDHSGSATGGNTKLKGTWAQGSLGGPKGSTTPFPNTHTHTRTHPSSSPKHALNPPRYAPSPFFHIIPTRRGSA